MYTFTEGLQFKLVIVLRDEYTKDITNISVAFKVEYSVENNKSIVTKTYLIILWYKTLLQNIIVLNRVHMCPGIYYISDECNANY